MFWFDGAGKGNHFGGEGGGPVSRTELETGLKNLKNGKDEGTGEAMLN